MKKTQMAIFYLSIFLLINLFLFFLAALHLRCCAQAFSSCSNGGATLHCSVGASHCSGLSCCGSWAVGMWASVVVARGLSSCGSWAVEHRLSSCGARA